MMRLHLEFSLQSRLLGHLIQRTIGMALAAVLARWGQPITEILLSPCLPAFFCAVGFIHTSESIDACPS